MLTEEQKARMKAGRQKKADVTKAAAAKRAHGLKLKAARHASLCSMLTKSEGTTTGMLHEALKESARLLKALALD